MSSGATPASGTKLKPAEHWYGHLPMTPHINCSSINMQVPEDIFASVVDEIDREQRQFAKLDAEEEAVNYFLCGCYPISVCPDCLGHRPS